MSDGHAHPRVQDVRRVGVLGTELERQAPPVQRHECHRAAVLGRPLSLQHAPLADAERAIHSQVRGAAEQRRQHAVLVRVPDDPHPADARAAERVSVEGDRFDEGARLPVVQAVGTCSDVLGRPVRIVEEAL